MVSHFRHCPCMGLYDPCYSGPRTWTWIPVSIARNSFLCALFSTQICKRCLKNFSYKGCFSGENSFPCKRRFSDHLLYLIRKVEMFGWYFWLTYQKKKMPAEFFKNISRIRWKGQTNIHIDISKMLLHLFSTKSQITEKFKRCNKVI